MTFGTILVHQDGGGRDAIHLDMALSLAAEHKAYLVGLHVIHPFYPSMGAFGDAAAGAIAEIQNRHLEAARDSAAKLQSQVEGRVKQAGVAFEWRSMEGFADDIVPLHARYADITILGQTDPDSDSPTASPSLPAHVVLGSGRPVLVVPYAGKYTSFGKRVLVAWSGTREAARAVHDALPLLKRAEKVSILSINPRDEGHIAGFDIAAHLARHGVNTEAERTVAADISVGDVILSEAADHGADLIVMGAYGHSRLRELVLGGATQRILGSMTAPVLMSH